MSTTLLAAEQALSKELSDYWSSTTTGAGSATTLVDSALMAKANDWVTDNTWAILLYEPSGAAAIYDERKVSTLSNTDGTLTTLTFAAAPGSGVDYSLHRLFSPSDKRIALIAAAKNGYPDIFNEIWDESIVSGNWLKDGSFEQWTTSTDLTNWTDTTVTTTQTSTAGYTRHGTYSVALSGVAGTLVQEWKAGTAEFEDLKYLRGRSATFTCQGWAAEASDLRISINDGTTQTYSSYHAGDNAWTEDNPRNDSFYVTQYITPNATQVTFTIHWNGLGAAYVDDARVISEPRGKLYIGHLNIARNRPHQVSIEPSYYSQEEDWVRISDYKVDPSGYIYLPTGYVSDRRLRIRGIGYLDFLVSGVNSTAWTATIAIDDPQLKILVAEAALYLYMQMSLPNFETGTRDEYQKAAAYWRSESASRRAKFGMISPPASAHWGIG